MHDNRLKKRSSPVRKHAGRVEVPRQRLVAVGRGGATATIPEQRVGPGRKDGTRAAIPLLGVDVTPASASEVLDLVDYRANGARRIVVGHNLHSVYLLHTDPIFAELYRTADAVLIDGQPVRWAGRLSNRQAEAWDPAVRVGSVDWLRQVDRLRNVRRIAVVGGHQPVNEATVALLEQQSSTDVRGWPGYPWDESRARTVVKELAEFGPDLTIIGLGMPVQEHFLHRFRSELPPSTYALVGGAIDQLCGYQKRAPRWIGRIGLEWLWRLVLDPRRFARRYLLEPWKLLAVLAKHHLSRLEPEGARQRSGADGIPRPRETGRRTA